MPYPDTFIIGGGIVGLTTAYLLAKAGVRVTVADRGELGKEASWAGAGIIPPAIRRSESPLEQLRSYSVEQFPSLSDELKSLTGIDNEYHHCGGVECLPAKDWEAVQLWRNAGVTFQTLTNAPSWLRPPTDSMCYSLPYSQVRNPRHLAALIAACERLGVVLLPHQRIDPRTLPAADKYLIASGAWTGELIPSLPVCPVRGQIVLFRCDQLPFAHILMHGKRYLVEGIEHVDQRHRRKVEAVDARGVTHRHEV